MYWETAELIAVEELHCHMPPAHNNFNIFFLFSFISLNRLFVRWTTAIWVEECRQVTRSHYQSLTTGKFASQHCHCWAQKSLGAISQTYECHLLARYLLLTERSPNTNRFPQEASSNVLLTSGTHSVRVLRSAVCSCLQNWFGAFWH